MPTPLYHFTPIHHLGSIIEHGLLCDNGAAAGLLAIEVSFLSGYCGTNKA